MNNSLLDSATRHDLESGHDPLHRGLDVVSRPAPNRKQDDLLVNDGGDDLDAFWLRRAVATRQTVEAF